MASGEVFEQGYDTSRFQGEINNNLVCPICVSIVRDPVMCRRNEHCFCRSCITRHLENFQRCPNCMEDLTVETLTPVPRIMRDLLSQLRIRCDFFDRGCVEFVPLDDLAKHVQNCGFSPVTCENDGCRLVVNRMHKQRHEQEACQFRQIKCHDCVSLRQDVAVLSQKVGKLQEGLARLYDGMNANQAVLKDDVTGLRGEVKANETAMKNMVEHMNASLANINHQIQAGFTQIKDQFTPQQQLGQVLQKKPTEMPAENIHCPTHEIMILGGTYRNGKLATVERFVPSTKAWELCKPMDVARSSAAACVDDCHQVFITGGVTDNGSITDTVGQCKGGRWNNAWGKLPAALYGHGCVAQNETLFITGGHSNHVSENVYGISYTTRTGVLLMQLPFQRCFHCSLLYNNTILVCGGRTGDSPSTSVANIVQLDVTRKQCKELPPLPFPVSKMAAVESNGDLFVIGGVDKDGNRLHSMVKYNIRTGRSQMLPRMRCERNGCTAVVANGGIVVMGGWDKGGNELKSVERFDLGSYTWEFMPDMLQGRFGATAVTLPLY